MNDKYSAAGWKDNVIINLQSNLYAEIMRFFITFSRMESLSEITSSEATGKIIG